MKIVASIHCVISAAAVGFLGIQSLEADTVITHPFIGVTLIARNEVAPRRLAMHIALIDLTAPGLSFKLTPHAGRLDTIRQTTLSFLKQQHAQLAINAHFFLPFPSTDQEANLVGLAASEGDVYSPFEPQPIAPGYPDQSFALMPHSPGLNIDRLNRASLVHLDPVFPDNQHVLEPVVLWNVVSGSAQIVSNGVRTVPTSAEQREGPISYLRSPLTDTWYSALHARTAIGLTADNRTLIWFTVDEAGGSLGLSVRELADVLIRDYQVWNALNLDGAGSTSMAIEDPLDRSGRFFNTPSDGPQGRSVGSSLALFALPGSEPIARLAYTLTATRSVILSWRSNAKGWQLEQTPRLSSGQWIKANIQPQVTDATMVIRPEPRQARYYRLVR